RARARSWVPRFESGARGPSPKSLQAYESSVGCPSGSKSQQLSTLLLVLIFRQAAIVCAASVHLRHSAASAPAAFCAELEASVHLPCPIDTSARRPPHGSAVPAPSTAA